MAAQDISNEASFEAARARAAKSAAAGVMLDVAAYLGPGGIPIEVFAGVREAANGMHALVDAGLARYETVDGYGAGFSIERAHQALARARLERNGESAQAIRRSLQLLCAAFAAASQLLEPRRARCDALIGHANALLAYAPDEGEDARLTSDLLHKVARHLFSEARYSEAESIVRRSGAIDETTLGNEDEAVAQDQANLAILLHELGRPREGVPHIRHAIAVGELHFGPQHPIVAERYNILATLLEEAGQPAQADPYIRQALIAAERTLGPDHPETRLYRENYERIIADVDALARRDELVEAGQLPPPPERLARPDLPPPGARRRGVLARLLRAR